MSDEQQITSENDQMLSFFPHMWDKLNEIQHQQNYGGKLLSEFVVLCKNYYTALNRFSGELKKCHDQFQKFSSAPIKKVDNNYFGLKKQESKPESDASFNLMSEQVEVLRVSMQQMSKLVDDRASLILGDLVDPLDMFISDIDQQVSDQIETAKTLMGDLQDKQSRHQEMEKVYHKISHECEQNEIEIEKALLSFEQKQIDEEKLNQVMSKAVNAKYKAQVAQKDYKDSVEELNEMHKAMELKYKPLLDDIQHTEASRINFTKYNLDKFMKHIVQFGEQITQVGASNKEKLGNFTKDNELQKFILANKSSTEYPCSQKVEFVYYQASAELKRYKSYLAQQTKDLKQITENRDSALLEVDQNKKKLLEVIHNIIFHKESGLSEEEIVPSREQMSKIILAFHEKEVRMQLTENLKSIGTPRQVVSMHGLQTLGELIKYLLTAIIHEKDVNFRVIHAILNVSQLIYYQEYQKNEQTKQKVRHRVYLVHFVQDHGIWAEENIWKAVLQKIINHKFQEAVLKQKDSMPEEEPDFDDYKTSIKSYFGKTLKNVWGSAGSQLSQAKPEEKKKQTMRIPKTLAQNITFNTISTFMFHMVNFGLSLENSKEIILFFSKRYELDQSRTHLLLSELQSAQNQSKIGITKVDRQTIQREKYTRRFAKNHDNTKMLIVSLVLKFMGPGPENDVDLFKFMVLSKLNKKILEKKVYKYALVYEHDFSRLRKKRNGIWARLLELDTDTKDYYAFRDKVISNGKADRLFEDDGEIYETQILNAQVAELIAMDVQRSFHQYRHIVKPEILNNILKTYAYFNPEIEYCQGMNFVAGFLYLVFRDEQMSFRALMRVAEKFDMSHLYKRELPKLKLFFYQLDRLIAVKLPILHQHFKDEQINSGIFASAWFITQFTSSLQLSDKFYDPKQTDNNTGLISDNLLQLWDYFISSGWKAIFKMSLYILKQNEIILLHQSFEEILTLIPEQPKILLASDCFNLDEIEIDLQKKSEIVLNQAAGCEEDIIESTEPSKVHGPRTLYNRFKSIENEELDYLLKKFESEFNEQSKMSEQRKKINL